MTSKDWQSLQGYLPFLWQRNFRLGVSSISYWQYNIEPKFGVICGLQSLGIELGRAWFFSWVAGSSAVAPQPYRTGWFTRRERGARSGCSCWLGSAARAGSIRRLTRGGFAARAGSIQLRLRWLGSAAGSGSRRARVRWVQPYARYGARRLVATGGWLLPPGCQPGPRRPHPVASRGGIFWGGGRSQKFFDPPSYMFLPMKIVNFQL